MKTTLDIPESILLKTQAVAEKSGHSVEDIVIRALERELSDESGESVPGHRVQLPLIVSKQPGKLDLSNFDFDDLLT
jgi:hypothetical protein